MGLPRGTPRERVIHGQVAAPASAHAKRRAADLSDAIVYVDRLPAPASPASKSKAAATSSKARSVKKKSAPANGKSAAAPTPEIVARGDGFSPRVLVVVAGTRVAFRNTDRVYHSTFSVSRAKKFDLGSYAPGQRRTVVFDRPGVVDVFCGLHPKASGFVVVVPNPFYARADASGAFSLAPLPPGRYTVRIWHPRYGERKATVDLTAAADADLMVKF